MPFLDSKNIRPLYDVIDGGPPQAFRCKIPECRDVTVTLQGMISHQLYKHGIKQQSEIHFDDLQHLTVIEEVVVEKGPESNGA